MIKKTDAKEEVILNKKESVSDELKDAKELYEKAIEAQKQGNWAEYGENIKRLGDILNKLNHPK